MSSLWAPSLALALRVLGGSADWAVGAHAEVAGGSSPLSAEDAIAPAAEGFFELHTGLRVRTPTSTLVLRYAPRLFGRLPGTEQLGRPLLWQTLRLSYLERATPRWTLELSGVGNTGEIAYSNIQGLFPVGTGPAAVSTISLAMGSLEASSAYRVSRRNTLRLTLQGGGQAPLPSTELEAPGVVPRFVQGGVELADDYRLSRRDTLTVAGNVGIFESDQWGGIAIYGADGALVRRTSESSRLSLQVGGVAARESSRATLQVIPTVSMTYGWNWGARNRPWSAEVSGGTRGFFDALTYDYRPVAFVGAEVTTIQHPSFRSGARVTSFTSLDSEPSDLVLFETVSSLEFPSSYTLSDRVDLLFGARGSWLAPHLSEFSGEPHQWRFLVFLGVRHRDGTSPSRGDWLN